MKVERTGDNSSKRPVNNKKYFYVTLLLLSLALLVVIFIVAFLLLSKNDGSTKFNDKTVTSKTGNSTTVEPKRQCDAESGVSIKLKIKNDVISVVEQPIIVDGYPNYLPEKNDFSAKMISSEGDVLGEYSFSDPRIILGEAGYQGPTKLDEAEFYLILPYCENANKIYVYYNDKFEYSIDISNLNNA